MKKKLLIQGLTKFIIGFVLLALLIFLPAGTLAFFNGWLFMALLFAPMLVVGIILYINKPERLQKRLDAKEKQNEQKGVVAFSGLMFLAGFIVAGLDHRFGWLELPLWIVIAASVVFILAYIMYAEVLRENVYLSRTIEVQEDQKVIDTGLYGVVRHPMYAATVLMFLSIPLVLGSLYSFFVFLLYPVIIVIRIINEEKVLTEGLKGYADYKKKVRYRLIPFIW